MATIWDAIIPAAATLLGADMRNRQATQAAANQQAFQERMSSTAYQRAMQDMREAGLNPMLAAKVGGASTPAGAMPNLSNIFGEAAGAYTSAYQAETGRREQEQQGEMIAAQIDKVAADTGVSRERVREIGEHINLMMSQRWTETEKGNMVRQQILKLRQEVGRETAARFLKELEADAYANMDKKVINPYTGRLILEFANSGLKALGSLVAPAVVGRAIRGFRK